MKQPSEPIFNIPAVIVALVAAFAAIHALRELVLTQDEDIEFLLRFAFIPARYDASAIPGGPFPGGLGADIWTFVTYAFIHGDIIHLSVNVVWFLPFGAAVARRLGNERFLIFFAVTAAAGAGAHLVTHPGALYPMVGASAAISGCMAAAIRFAFEPGGPLETWRHAPPEAYRVPAAPLTVALREPRILIFLIVWFVLNALFGLGADLIPGAEQAVAWQAHIGGFVAGLLLFAIFDPVKTPHVGDDGEGRPVTDADGP